MSKVIPRSYTDDFKPEAIKLGEEVGLTEAANRPGIPLGTLTHWSSAWRAKKLFKDGQPKA